MANTNVPVKVRGGCSRHEGSGPAGLPKSVEEVQKKGCVALLCDLQGGAMNRAFCGPAAAAVWGL